MGVVAHTYDTGQVLTLAQRLALDAVDLHRTNVLASARDRVDGGSYAEFGALSVEDVLAAADEARDLVRAAVASAPHPRRRTLNEAAHKAQPPARHKGHR